MHDSGLKRITYQLHHIYLESSLIPPMIGASLLFANGSCICLDGDRRLTVRCWSTNQLVQYGVVGTRKIPPHMAYRDLENKLDNIGNCKIITNSLGMLRTFHFVSHFLFGCAAYAQYTQRIICRLHLVECSKAHTRGIFVTSNIRKSDTTLTGQELKNQALGSLRCYHEIHEIHMQFRFQNSIESDHFYCHSLSPPQHLIFQITSPFSQLQEYVTADG